MTRMRLFFPFENQEDYIDQLVYGHPGLWYKRYGDSILVEVLVEVLDEQLLIYRDGEDVV